MDVSQGDVKRQVSNVVKAVMATYKFRTMGEYRALLSLYNVTVEEARGMVDGREYHGLVYFPLSPDNSSATNGAGNKTGNPFKASRIGKSVGYEAVQRRFEFSKGQIRDRRLAETTRRTVAAALARTYRREEFVALLKAKGVDVVFRYTDEGRIYGATFIDHRTGVFSTARVWARSFPPTLAGAFHPAVCRYSAHAFHCCGGRAAARRPSRRGTRRGVFLRLGLARWRRFGAQAEEAAFETRLKRRRKKRRKGQDYNSVIHT